MQKKQLLGLAMAVAIGMIPSYPAEAYTFRSKGMIDFPNGNDSIIFDARDFSTIENNIIQGKQNIISALEHIKTYFRADGTPQIGSRPDNPYTGDIGQLSFTQIADAIKKSQDVPDGMQPATPDNLSAGVSAWVNGELIIGTGGDNTASREEGKQEGLNEAKVGTAGAGEVLTGKTFTNASEVGIQGTMPNNGSWKNTPSSKGKVTIPKGYHDGTGYVDTNEVYTQGYNDKLVQFVDLGEGTTFDLTSYDGYENFVVGQQILVVPNTISIRSSFSTGNASGNVSGSVNITESLYSATYENGILTINITNAKGSGNVRDSFENVGKLNATATITCKVYLAI